MKNSMLVLALVLAPVVARAQTVDGQKRIGFVIEPHLSSSLFVVQNNRLPDGTVASTTFGAIGSSTSGAGMNASSSADSTSFVVAPGVRVAILRSRDQRVEFFGQFDIGFGTTVTGGSVMQTPPGSSTSQFHLSYDVGPGLRYWVHPQFAVGAVTGVRGDFEFDSVSSQGVTQSQSSGLTSIFAALQLTGVF
jgi:hypothetical protein